MYGSSHIVVLYIVSILVITISIYFILCFIINFISLPPPSPTSHTSNVKWGATPMTASQVAPGVPPVAPVAATGTAAFTATGGDQDWNIASAPTTRDWAEETAGDWGTTEPKVRRKGKTLVFSDNLCTVCKQKSGSLLLTSLSLHNIIVHGPNILHNQCKILN